jgi:hypothetical protein
MDKNKCQKIGQKSPENSDLFDRFPCVITSLGYIAGFDEFLKLSKTRFKKWSKGRVLWYNYSRDYTDLSCTTISRAAFPHNR